MYNVNLSEIHVEGEVHELFREISNGEDEHGDTNGDRNSTWKLLSFSFCYDNFTDKGMEGRSVDFLYTICRYIATIHTDIVEKLTRSVEIVSKKNGHYFLNQHYLYKDRLYLLVRQDLLK